MEEYYVSMAYFSGNRDVGDIVKRDGLYKYIKANGNWWNTGSASNFSDYNNFIPATLQEIEAYKSGIGNIKDMIINDLNIIEIW